MSLLVQTNFKDNTISFIYTKTVSEVNIIDAPIQEVT